MESAKTKIKINYTIRTKVSRVWEHFQDQYLRGVGKDAVFTKVFMGWYVAFEGSYEALFFGKEQPDLKVGDKVEIKFEKVNE